jgi:hypothetical protein
MSPLVAGRYRLLKRIGRGGQAEVWEAEDEIARARVAIKVLDGLHGLQAARVRREIAALRVLRLPGVVSLLDEGLDEAGAYIVMERLEGHPFPGPPREGAWRWEEIEGTALLLLETLARVHAAGVLHRDLKPANVIVDADGRPTILDFGLSRFAEPDAQRITGRNEVFGTIAYLAPEQLCGDPVTPRTDLYAVGIMLYRALAGRLPHEARGWGALVRERIGQPTTPLRARAPEVPSAVAAAVDHLLAVQPDERPTSAAHARTLLCGGAARPGDDAARIARSLRLAQGEGAAPEAALDAPALEALFGGPDRLFHLREDAARALWARTSGRPDRIVDELLAWARAGLGRWDGDLLVVDRDALERLATGLWVAPAPAPTVAALPPYLDELLFWIEVAAGDAAAPLLAAVTGRPRDVVEEDLAELVARGEVLRNDDGHLAPLSRSSAGERGAEEPRRAAHRAIAAALPPGAPGRLAHLLAGGDDTDPAAPAAVAREALARAQHLAQKGQLGQATRTLADGTRATRWTAPASHAEARALLGLWTAIAISTSTPADVDPLLYALHLAGVRHGFLEPAPDPQLVQLEQLGRAALAIPGEAALARVDAVPPFADPLLEQQRHALRLRAARLFDADRYEQVLAAAAAWAQQRADAAARAALAGWTSRLRQRQGRFAEAAALALEASAGEPWATARIRWMVTAASDLLEAFRPEEAARCAAEAIELARACRLPAQEAHAAWLLRTTSYRTGQAGAPDLELVEAARGVDAVTEGLIVTTEATVAYRAGVEAAAPLAERATRIWTLLNHTSSALVARALALAGGAPAAPGEAAALAAQAGIVPGPGVGLQVLALLARADASLRVPVATVDRLAEQVPAAHWADRLDVLSVDESLAALQAARA